MLGPGKYAEPELSQTMKLVRTLVGATEICAIFPIVTIVFAMSMTKPNFIKEFRAFVAS
jgi:hypothetical protein